MSKLAKLYETLTIDERTKLFIEAMARNDDQEIDTLENTCPQKTYRMADYAYKRRKLELMIRATTYTLGTHKIASIAMSSMVGMLAFDDDDKFETCRRAFEKSASIFKSREKAWKIYCEEIGLDSDHVLEAFKINPIWKEDGIDGLMSLADDIEPDPVATENTLAGLREAWG